MKGQPLISIIVPVFNLEKYIDRCVKSILRQSYPNIELILVDDGSTDSSAKICKKYCECDPRVQLFRTGNKGVSSARNLGIARAAGVYIAFIDGDDTVEENYIEILYRCLILKMWTSYFAAYVRFMSIKIWSTRFASTRIWMDS